jgi:molybdenum cofactor sulfurtransferase
VAILGKCRRCQMVCVNPETGERGEEPFVSLWRTRREGGKVWFGVHSTLTESVKGVIRVGMEGWGV